MEVDAGTEVLPLAGRWVMPGLVDTHTHMPGVEDQPRFLATLLSFGVTTARSTAAAPSGVGTRSGARALGIDVRTGTLEVGKAADMLVLGADPTADVSAVRALEYVVAAGTVWRPEALRR